MPETNNVGTQLMTAQDLTNRNILSVYIRKGEEDTREEVVDLNPGGNNPLHLTVADLRTRLGIAQGAPASIWGNPVSDDRVITANDQLVDFDERRIGDRQIRVNYGGRSENVEVGNRNYQVSDIVAMMKLRLNTGDRPVVRVGGRQVNYDEDVLPGQVIDIEMPADEKAGS